MLCRFHVWQAPAQFTHLAANAASSSAAFLCGPARDRKTAPNEIAAATDARPHVRLPPGRAARRRDPRDCCGARAGCASSARGRLRSAAARARRRGAGVLASASADLRALLVDRRSGLKPGFMISPSVDGQAPTMLAALYGAHVVRGSGSYTGVRAVRGVHQAIVKDGISPASRRTGRADRGSSSSRARSSPRRSVGKAVVPIAYAAKPGVDAEDLGQVRASRRRSPRSASRSASRIFRRRRLDDEQMAAAQRELERRMLRNVSGQLRLLSTNRSVR